MGKTKGKKDTNIRIQATKQFQKSKKLSNANNYFNLLGLAVITVLGILIYSNSFNCPFELDDLQNIMNNTSIRNLSDVHAWWNFYPMRPLGVLSFAINYHFNQLDVWYYHLVNLIIHLINACLVWWLTLQLFSSPTLANNPIIKHKKEIALIAALLFVSHPLATQSVTYIVQRMASMAAMFYLISVALYLKFRIPTFNKKNKYFLLAGSILSAVAAMLSKENAFTLPFVIILLEIFFLQTKKLHINLKDYRLLLSITALIGFIVFVLFNFSFSIFKPIPPSNGYTYSLTSLNYLFTEFGVILKYIQLLFLPINQNLDHDFPIAYHFFEIRTILSLLFLLALIAVGILSFKKYRILSFGFFWFFITISIESSIIPLQDVMFEHRTYLPSFGFFLIITSGLYILLWKKFKYVAIAIFAIIVVSNSYLTFARNAVWKDRVTLWNDVVLKSPHKARPYYNRAVVLEMAENHDQALKDYTKAIELNPSYVMAYNNRAALFKKDKKYNLAIDDYTKAIEMDTNYINAYYNRGNTFMDLKESDKALSDYSKVIALDPYYLEAYINRGDIYLYAQNYDKALLDFNKVISLDPNYHLAYFNRGVVSYNQKKYKDALMDYNKAITLKPDYAQAIYSRGLARYFLGIADSACMDIKQAGNLGYPVPADAMKEICK